MVTLTGRPVRRFSAPTRLAIALAAVSLTGCGLDRDGPAGDVTVGLGEVGDSGRSGTAALSAEGEQTLVVIETAGDPVSELQAAHIHEGSCDELSPEPAFGLQRTSGGRSATTVDLPLDTLTGGTYAIALHPDDDMTSHTSCANLEP